LRLVVDCGSFTDCRFRKSLPDLGKYGTPIIVTGQARDRRLHRGSLNFCLRYFCAEVRRQEEGGERRGRKGGRGGGGGRGGRTSS
jgi:hypothetical protein